MNLFKSDTIVNILNSLGWTLIHSVWQGLVLLVFFLLLVILFKHKHVQFRYSIGLIMLTVFLSSVIVTFIITFNHQHSFIHSHSVSLNTYSISLSNNPGQLITDNVEQIENRPDKSFKVLLQTVQKLFFYLNKSSIAIAVIWLVCVIALLVNHLLSFFNLKRLVKNPVNRESGKWQTSVNRICSKINLNKKIKILISPYINSPFVFGVIKPVILFPLKLITGLSEEEIRAILTHELAHIRRYDPVVNVFQVFMESFFFYQPGVWYISKHMRAQREIMCDTVAAGLCGNKKMYVNALVKIEELRLEYNPFAVAAKRNKNELLYRIRYLLSNQTGKAKNRKSFNLMLPLITLLVFLSFLFTAFKSPADNDTIQQKYFNEVVQKYLSPAKSSMVVYDTRNKQYLFYNDSICRQQYTPVSTFKIASSLFALESGIAEDINFTIPWDSIKFPGEPWMHNAEPQKYWFQDQNLQSAIKYSVNWFYFELHRLIGKERMQKYITQCGYGNENVGSEFDEFWFDGSLKISAIEQVRFLDKLYHKSLTGFSDRSQEEVIKIMLSESNENFKIYGKTGTGKTGDDKFLCWYVGFLETNDNTYVFAFNTFADSYQEMPVDKRIEIIRQVFHDLNKIAIYNNI